MVFVYVYVYMQLLYLNVYIHFGKQYHIESEVESTVQIIAITAVISFDNPN